MMSLGNAPITQGIILSTIAASAVVHVRDPRGEWNVTLDIWKVLTDREVWRLGSCHAVCTSMGTLVATSLSLYRLRVLEPVLGSRKFSAFLVVTWALALPFEATAGVYFGTVRLTPGPLPLVFALLVMHYAMVPAIKPKLFGALGMDFSDKALTYCLGGMLAFCEGWDSLVPALCGALVGGLYMVDAMSLQSFRLPSLLNRFCARFCRPMLATRRRPGPPAGPARSHRRSTGSPLQRAAGSSQMDSSVRNLASLFSQAQGSSRLRSVPQAPPSVPSEEMIGSLMGMGFDRSSATEALRYTGNNVTAAANLLVSGGMRGRGSMGVDVDAGAVGGSNGHDGPGDHDHHS